jgi:hypothetical protein
MLQQAKSESLFSEALCSDICLSKPSGRSQAPLLVLRVLIVPCSLTKLVRVVKTNKASIQIDLIICKKRLLLPGS